jgi:putative glycosyltransferase (TIGR04372 family)
MSFIRQQIRHIRKGGWPVFWNKIRYLPVWFGKTRCGLTIKKYLFTLAATILPFSAKAHLELGKALSQLQPNEAAVSSLKKAIALKPGLTGAYVCLAETLIKLNRFDEAFTAWEQAFKLSPELFEIHTRIQNSFFFNGQTWAARSIMQKIIDHNNETAGARQLDKLGVRFLKEFPTALGHIALLDMYVKMDALGWRSKDRPVLLVHPNLSNPCYLDYWKQYLPDMISDPAILKMLSPFEKYLEDRIFVVKNADGEQQQGDDYGGTTLMAKIQEQWEAERRGPLLKLKDSDRERGWDCLKKLGVSPDAWFVSVHVREGKTTERAARDAGVFTYVEAMKAIVERGGWVVRMGGPDMTPLPPMPNVIDYAHSHVRSDWMDVFLWAGCRFFIGTQSGPAWVPPTFGVPCLASNWTFYSHRWYKDDLFIPKLIYSDKDNRYFTFNEILSTELKDVESFEYFTSQRKIRIEANSPEDIKNAALELLERLDHKLVYTPEDEDFQRRFTSICDKNHWPGKSRIGKDFLRKWESLLS